jgi:hypothetical protein
MVRHLFIIARDQRDLYRYVQREFSAEETVEVILDRREKRDRRSGRDRRVVPRADETQDRRAGHRRTNPSVDSQLRSVGYIMVRIGSARAPSG